MNKNQLFIEETLPDHSYNIVWCGEDAREAVKQLTEYQTKNRLELWTKAHAETCKGFAPLGYRTFGADKISLSHTFTFLHLGLTSKGE